MNRKACRRNEHVRRSCLLHLSSFSASFLFAAGNSLAGRATILPFRFPPVVCYRSGGDSDFALQPVFKVNLAAVVALTGEPSPPPTAYDHTASRRASQEQSGKSLSLQEIGAGQISTTAARHDRSPNSFRLLPIQRSCETNMGARDMPKERATRQALALWGSPKASARSITPPRLDAALPCPGQCGPAGRVIAPGSGTKNGPKTLPAG